MRFAALLAFIVLFAGCESCTDPFGTRTQCLDCGCLLDSDCGDDTVCEADFCAQTCTASEQCAEGFACAPRSRGSGAFCEVDALVEEEFGPCALALAPDEFCRQELGVDGAVCGVLGECGVASTRPRYVFQIQDRSEGPACSGDAPGTDILGAELLDRDQNVVGYGEYFFSSFRAQDINEPGEFASLDGMPDSNAGTCPADSESAVSLHCPGWIAFQFRDATGDRLALRTGWSVQVYEFGSLCNDPGQVGESYVTRLCRTPSEVLEGDDSSCDIELNSGESIGQFVLR